MSKELTVQQMPVTDMMSMAKTFVESGMFTDTKAVAQAFVKIQAGQEIGVAPFAAMSGVHVIQGKPTIGAGIMAARIKASGKYNYKVIKMEDTECSIDFYEGKDLIGNSKFTIADAKKAQTKNIEKFPKNMLFARAISNGLKWYCPDVFSGPVYVPEEMDDAENINQDKKSQVKTKQKTEDGVAYCTNEDIDLIMSLLDNEQMPAIIFKSEERPNGYNKANMKTALQKQFDAGTYEKHRAEAQIKALQDELALHTGTEDAPDVDMTAEDPKEAEQPKAEAPAEAKAEPVTIESKPAMQPNEGFENFK